MYKIPCIITIRWKRRKSAQTSGFFALPGQHFVRDRRLPSLPSVLATEQQLAREIHRDIRDRISVRPLCFLDNVTQIGVITRYVQVVFKLSTVIFLEKLSKYLKIQNTKSGFKKLNVTKT